MTKKLFIGIVLASIACATMANTAVTPPPKRDMRANPPGKFIAPGYFVSNAFIAETVNIACEDGYTLAGDMIKRRRSGMEQASGILFLHEAGKDRKSWYPLTVQLAGRGFNVLAIDLRGCGENPKLNKSGKTLDKLPEADVRKMLDDIRNSVSHLALSLGTNPESIAVIGAGLGANLAIAAANEPWAKNVRLVIALSPSLDDRGYKTEEAAKNIGKKTMVCLAASRGNSTPFQASTVIYGLLTGPKDFFEGDGEGYGVGLFGARSVAAPKDGETPPILFSHLPQWVYQGFKLQSSALPPARKPAKR